MIDQAMSHALSLIESDILFNVYFSFLQEDNGVVQGGAMSHTSSLIKSDIVFDWGFIDAEGQRGGGRPGDVAHIKTDQE